MGSQTTKLRIRRDVVFILLLIMLPVLAACVQPVETTPTPLFEVGVAVTLTPGTLSGPGTMPMIPTVPGAAGFAASITNYFMSFGMIANNPVILTQQILGSDSLIVFVAQNMTGNVCAGIVQTTAGNQQILTGDLRCPPAGTPVMTGTLIFALTSGTYYVAAYGYVDPSLAPSAGGVAVEFSDGSSASQLLVNQGFIVSKAGVVFPTRAIVADQGGNLIAIVPLQ